MRASRIAAVQILYQMEFNSFTEPLEKISNSLYRSYLEDNKKQEIAKILNVSFIEKIISKAISDKENILETIGEYLKENWNIEELSLILQLILRLAISEILETETDLPIIFNEYITITKRFENDEDAKFVNNILEKIAFKIRGA